MKDKKKHGTNYKTDQAFIINNWKVCRAQTQLEYTKVETSRHTRDLTKESETNWPKGWSKDLRRGGATEHERTQQGKMTRLQEIILIQVRVP